MFLVFFSVPMMFVSVVGTHDDYYFTTLTVLSGDCVSSQNCVTSGNFPRNYGNYEQCSIATPPGFICATSFRTEEGFDHLTVSDTVFDGLSGPQDVEVHAGDVLTWTTDRSWTEKGWEICWSPFSGDECFRDTTSTVLSTTSTVLGSDGCFHGVTTLTVLSGDCVSSQNCVASGNFPSNYGNQEGCSIATPAGFISATSFHTEEGYDHFTVNDMEFDGTSGPQDVPVYAGDVLIWTTDQSVTQKGWEICWSPFYSDDGFGVQGTASISTISSGLATLCSSNAALEEAVIMGTVAVTSVAVDHVERVLLSRCDLGVQSSSVVVDFVFAFELAFDTEETASCVTTSILEQANSFNEVVSAALSSSLQVPVTVGLVKVAWNSLTTTAARDTILISAAPAPSPMVTIAVTCLVFFVLTDVALRPRENVVQSSTQLVVRV